MSHPISQLSGSVELIELSEDDLMGIQGGGWFKNLTGISTPKFLKDLDDRVNEKPGGWVAVLGKVIVSYYSGGSLGTFVQENLL
jgi:hypothetical protein